MHRTALKYLPKTWKFLSKLDDAERDALEGPLTYEECKKSLETFENGNHQARTVLL